MKKWTSLIAAVLASLLLCGCGSIFQAEYYRETEYDSPEQAEQPPKDKVTVKNRAELKSEVLALAYAGQDEGNIAFDPAYDGDAREDLEATCAMMHREDALWAYCVQSVRYEISHIVTNDVAKLRVEYAESARPVDEILQLNYATGLEKIMREAMEQGSSSAVILIAKSSYSADSMERLVSAVYRSNPLCSTVEPNADVHMYSGAGRQRLYEINFRYALSQEQLMERRGQLQRLNIERLLNTKEQDTPQAALTACRYLMENCVLSTDRTKNTAYDALIGGEANSEGLALAYMALCQQLKIPCRIVYGQRQWREHCWNIIDLEGQHYHVDMAACVENGAETGFLLNDESMWAHYRWDTSSYDICQGDLDYWKVSGLSRPTDQQTVPAVETESPKVTDTPSETEAPEATDAPSETETPEATEAPAETETPEATEAPAETETPEATETPTETEMPGHTETPGDDKS